MKKTLLVGSSLLIAISAYPQNGRKFQPSGCINVAKELSHRFNVLDTELPNRPAPSNSTIKPEEEPVTANAKAAAVTVTKFTGSMNVYGMLVSHSKTLNWNDNVNAVSFIHRKSATYVSSPVSNSGSIVMMLSNNMGATWDSTCIWTNSSNLARYPQGGVYSAPGNANYNNAYAVGMGPATGGSGWTGNWYASKSVTLTPKNTPGADQQFFNNTGANGPLGKHDFARVGFSVTDDGIVHGLGNIFTDINATSDGLRGGQVIKGTFNAGAFVWSSDSLIPPVVTESGGDKSLAFNPFMAWNESGTVGYAMFIGSRLGATGSNVGWQPLVYKTSNSGASWALLSGIDFNSPAMQIVKDRIGGVTTNTNLEVPFFNIGEGIDLTVDGNNNLHIGCLINTSFSNHPDSASFSTVFGSAQTRYVYSNGGWPYIYDFVGDGSAPWKVFTIDSLPTEAPGAQSTSPSFSVNPWNVDANGDKVVSSNRLQLSRSVNGDRIAFIWAETDTNLTSSKFNQFPDLKARLACVANGTVTIDPNKTNITSTLPASAVNNRVKGKAYFHYVSPKMRLNGNLFEVPVTVTNSAPLDQLGANDNFYISAEITNFTCLVNINETKAGLNESGYTMMPNPAKGNVSVNVKLINSGTIDVAVYNLIGQVAKSVKANGEVGENTININLNDLSSGVYMVKVTVNGKVTTKKLVVE